MHVQNIEQTFSDNEKVKTLDQIPDNIKMRLKKYRKSFLILLIQHF
ncbi:hypothetical protein [Orientia tsutsugamushi]|nr:hypothetical protein [Orientia tsutsugamushi]